ncbi:MAG: biopolymer transporter ExbD [Candidatus Omnitrophota bacterium]|nr:biopolymer transporter ExbD [Candidatus Omnitrophota bacterium]
MKVPFDSLQRRPRIEIIPLIDVIFFLLASFLMVSLSMVKNQGIPVRLPVAATGKPNLADAPATVSVSKQGAFYLNKQAVSFEALRRQLQALQRKDPGLKVILQGDAGSDFGNVVKALDEMRKLGIERVALQTTAS